jgi:hypothetical protein
MAPTLLLTIWYKQFPHVRSYDMSNRHFPKERTDELANLTHTFTHDSGIAKKTGLTYN